MGANRSEEQTPGLYSLSLHDALPIWVLRTLLLAKLRIAGAVFLALAALGTGVAALTPGDGGEQIGRANAWTLLSFPSRRSSDLGAQDPVAGQAEDRRRRVSRPCRPRHRRGGADAGRWGRTDRKSKRLDSTLFPFTTLFRSGCSGPCCWPS